MSGSEALFARKIRNRLWMFAVLLLGIPPVQGQNYEVTGLVGGRYGGTIKLQQEGQTSYSLAQLEDSVSFGVAGGIRFDGDDCESCNLIEFRWMRQSTHLGLKQDVLVPTPLTAASFRPAVTLDHFLVDFTREWGFPEFQYLKPFVTASLGAARMSTPASSATRFAFGVGGGVKIFPKPRWGIRIEAEYLPTVMNVDVQRVVCTAGCIVALSGGLMNQFEFSGGPIFRF